MEEFLQLMKRHKVQMDEKRILISVYTNASGYLWQMMIVNSGTDLGWSRFSGDCKHSGTFTSYEKALEHALDLVAKCDLDKYKADCSADIFHWAGYADWVVANYGKE